MAQILAQKQESGKVHLNVSTLHRIKTLETVPVIIYKNHVTIQDHRPGEIN